MPQRLVTLRLYYLTTFAAVGAYYPFFPRWLEARGIEGLAMGAIMALAPALGVVSPPLVGFLADALSLRGSLLRVCCVGACLSMAALAATCAVLGAPGFGVIFPAVLAYAAFRAPMGMIADVVTLESAHREGTTYGRVRAWGSVGFLLGAFGTGRFLDVERAVAFPALIAGLLAVSIVSAWTLPAKSHGPRLPVAGEAQALLLSPDFALFLITNLVGQAGHVSYDLCFSLYLRDLHGSPLWIGGAWSLGTLAEVVLMTFAGPLLARFGSRRLMIVAFFGASMRWLIVAHVQSLPLLLALQPLHALTFGVWWISSVAYVRERAPAHALATAQGLFTAAGAVGAVAGMLTWGALYRRAGGSTTFEAASLVSFTAGILAVAWGRQARAVPVARPA